MIKFIQNSVFKATLLFFVVCISFCKISAQSKNFNLLKNFKCLKGDNLYVLGGINFSNQYIGTGNYASNFNYNIASINNNAYKPGFFGGFRYEAIQNKKHVYSFEVSLNKYTSGTNYKDAIKIAPFSESFSKYKADDQFFTLNTSLHYKKLIPLGDTINNKFYIVIGPSLETRLSTQSADNLINNNYQRFVVRGDIGFEFNNRSYYTLFLHYKQGLSSFTKSPIKTTFNSFTMGMMFKVSDLF